MAWTPFVNFFDADSIRSIVPYRSFVFSSDLDRLDEKDNDPDRRGIPVIIDLDSVSGLGPDGFL